MAKQRLRIWRGRVRSWSPGPAPGERRGDEMEGTSKGLAVARKITISFPKVEEKEKRLGLRAEV